MLIQGVSAKTPLPNSGMVHAKRSKADCSVTMQHTELVNIHLSVLCSWCPSCWDTVCLPLGNNLFFYLKAPAEAALRCSSVKFSDIGVVAQLYSGTQTATVPANEG